MMRIPIGGCDFDLSPWAYNEKPINDVNLSNFVQLDQRDLDKVYTYDKTLSTTKMIFPFSYSGITD